MRLSPHRTLPVWPRWPLARARLIAILAALCVLALATSACSLPAIQPTTGGNNGFSSNNGSVTVGSGQTTPVKVLHGGGGTAMVLVPMMIDGAGPYDFALDTGAGITLIDAQLADDLQLPVSGASAQVAGVGGTQNVTPVHIDTWNAGKITLPSADVGKAQLASFKQGSGVRGLLGSDILSRFGRITINYDTGELSVADAASAQSLVSPAVEPLAAIVKAALHL